MLPGSPAPVYYSIVKKSSNLAPHGALPAGVEAFDFGAVVAGEDEGRAAVVDADGVGAAVPLSQEGAVGVAGEGDIAADHAAFAGQAQPDGRPAFAEALGDILGA